MTVRDLMFPADRASEAATALKAGAPANAVLARFGGHDSRRTRDTEFYFAAKIHLGDRDFAMARALPGGGVSTPLAEADGTHLLYVAQNKPPVPMDFTQARDQVLADYRADAIARLRVGDEAFFRKRANILIARDLKP
jgi:hypothetical protein